MSTHALAPDPWLAGLVRDIVEHLRPEIDLKQIMVFGSYARGKSDPDSDLDLLIIAPSPERPLARRLRVRRLLAEIDAKLGLDILFYTPEEVVGFAEDPASFLHHIIKTGIIVYDQESPGTLA